MSRKTITGVSRVGTDRQPTIKNGGFLISQTGFLVVRVLRVLFKEGPEKNVFPRVYFPENEVILSWKLHTEYLNFLQQIAPQYGYHHSIHNTA